MKYLLPILTIFAVPLTSVVVYAGEKEDRESIRALFYQEQEGHARGDAEPEGEKRIPIDFSHG